MAISINPQSVSLIALYNFNQNTVSLAESVEKLSSGLRINRAADDAASLSIANKLDLQAKSMGQAIRNANDGISITQIADSTLEEAINIMNTIKTKAVQAAQDTLTDSSRQTIQEDINKLMMELDSMVNEAKFNEHPLLTGTFTNKVFQVGAYAGEDITAHLSSAQSSRIGHINKAQLSIANSTGGSIYLSFSNNRSGETLTLESVSVEYANDIDHSLKAVADNINKYSDETGISATAVVESTSTNTVEEGATDSSFSINGVTIGTVNTEANDSDGALINAINDKTSSTGVTASITSSGQLKLTSDGRPIEVSGAGTALDAADASSMSTFGYIQIYQQGSYQIDMTDLSSGLAVSFDTNLDYTGDMSTTIDSILATGSVIGSGSTLAAGSTIGATLTGAVLNGDITTTQSSTIESSSVLASTSVLAKNTVLGGTAINSSNITSTADTFLAADSVLISGSTLAAGTYLTNQITTSGGTVAAGSTLSADTVITADATMTNAMLLQTGSVLASGSTFASSSYIGGDITLGADMTLSQDMTLLSGSTITDTDGVTSLAAGSTIGGKVLIDASTVTTTQSTTIKSGSVLTSTSELATGSTIGGDITLNGDHTTTADLLLAADSILASGSTIAAGTILSNDLDTTGGTLTAGTTLSTDAVTTGSNTLNYAQTVKSGSVLADGTTLAANSGGYANTELSNESMVRLSDLSVLTREDAQTAMKIADAALDDLSNIRSSAGSTQNQFSSAVSYLTANKTNLRNAVSNLMDVDFAEESTNFARLEVLNQTGAFALSQANSMYSNMVGLLQNLE